MAAGSFLTSAAMGGAMQWLTKGIGGKLLAFVIAIFVFTAGFKFLKELLPAALTGSTLFDGIPGAVIWGLWFIDVPFGLTVCLGAYATAFLIKRLPVIG